MFFCVNQGHLRHQQVKYGVPFLIFLLYNHQLMVIGQRSVHGVTVRSRVEAELGHITETARTLTTASMVNTAQILTARQMYVTINIVLVNMEASI